MLLSGMSTRVVTPPAAAARVAVSKPSHSVRPGTFTWTCASTRPGMTTRSVASSTAQPGGTAFRSVRPTIRPPSIRTAASRSPSGVTIRRLTTASSGTSGRDEGTVRVRPAVAEELPDRADFVDGVEVEIGHHQRILVARALGHDLPPRVAEVALAVELAHLPRRLDPDPVDGPHEVAVGHGVGGLLQLPEVLGETGHGGRGVEHDLGAVQPEGAGPLGEVAVVADVHADLGVSGLEHRVAEVPGPEVELLPEARLAVRDVGLAVLAEVAAVRVDHRRGVVVDSRLLLLVHRHHQHHLVLPGQLLHEGDGRPVGDTLGQVVPARLLLGAEVRPVEQLLQAEDLDLLARGPIDQLQVLVDHGLLDGRQAGLRTLHVPGLDEAGTHDAPHGALLLPADGPRV